VRVDGSKKALASTRPRAQSVPPCDATSALQVSATANRSAMHAGDSWDTRRTSAPFQPVESIVGGGARGGCAAAAAPLAAATCVMIKQHAGMKIQATMAL